MPAQPSGDPVERGGRGAALGNDGPRDQIGDDADAAEERRGREQHPEQHRVDAEVLAEATGDAGEHPVGVTASQRRAAGWLGRSEGAGRASGRR